MRVVYCSLARSPLSRPALMSRLGRRYRLRRVPQIRPKLHAAEPVFRRILRILRAARKNRWNPGFEGLEVFARRLAGVSPPSHTSEFDKFVTDAQNVTDVQKVVAFIMKQDRLIREESAAAQRQERNANGEPAPKRQRRPAPKAKPEP